jgi:hypothetical protein
MELVEQVKTMTEKLAASAMLRIFSHVSPETFIDLSMLASSLIEGASVSAAEAAA